MLVVPLDQVIGDLQGAMSASASSTTCLTARREARSRTVTATLGTSTGRGEHWLRSTGCAIVTKSLRTTSPLKSLSSEVPRTETPLIRLDDFHAGAQGTQHPGRTQHLARFTQGVKPGKTPRKRSGHNDLHTNFGLTTGIGKRLRPGLQQTTVDGQQQTCIGSLLTGRLPMNEFAHLDGLTNRLTMTCPQLDALHRPPP